VGVGVEAGVDVDGEHLVTSFSEGATLAVEPAE